MRMIFPGAMCWREPALRRLRSPRRTAWPTGDRVHGEALYDGDGQGQERDAPARLDLPFPRLELATADVRDQVPCRCCRPAGAWQVRGHAVRRLFACVAGIEGVISTKHPGQKFIIVGHSMGGQIAARLAAKRPDLVSAVVSVDGSLGFFGDAAQVFGKTAQDLNINDPGVVAPALFELVYDPATDPAFRRWHARRAQCHGTSCASPSVRSSWEPTRSAPDRRARRSAEA
jgi:hypothetical protein